MIIENKKTGRKIKSGKTNIVKAMALTQILSLVLEIFAFAFIFSLSVGGVSGDEAPSWLASRTGSESNEIYFGTIQYGSINYEATINKGTPGRYELYNPNTKEYVGTYYADTNRISLFSEGSNQFVTSDSVTIDALQANYDQRINPNGAQPPTAVPAGATGDGINPGSYVRDYTPTTSPIDLSGTDYAGWDYVVDPTYVGGGYYVDPETNTHINAQQVADETGKTLPATTVSPGTTPNPQPYGNANYSILGLFSWGTNSSWGHFLGNLVEGVSWAAAALTLMNVFTQAGIIPEEMGTALGTSIAGGILAGKLTLGVIRGAGSYLPASGGSGVTGWIGENAGAISAGVGLITAYLIFAKQYTKTETKSENIEFKCMPWQAPNGGDSCNECNLDPLRPCSEYRCKALGQTCKIINEGTGEDKCIDGSPYDVTSPGIKPWDEILTVGYTYTSVTERPPGGDGPAGMTITNPSSTEGDGCLTAFTPFKFGVITTDSGDVTQPAQCKIDFNHTNSFDDMAYWMGDTNLYIENHSTAVSLPGASLINTSFPAINNEGQYTFYIRCMDGNGNTNEDEFAVNFCMEATPDLTPPEIKATSISSGSPVLYNVDNLSLNVYTNEPSNCRWSRRDTDYNNMENNMSCSNELWEMNAELLYTCVTTLTAIENGEENMFYFRCEDTGVNNMQMVQSYPFSVIGTQPLNILSVGPDGTIGSSTSTAVVNLSVRTDNGYRNGESTCYYSTSNSSSSYIEMLQTGEVNTHSQNLDLTGGLYNYYFKCVDLGGNTAYNFTNFTVYIDTFAPVVQRIYAAESKLVVITDEDSICSYSTSSCNFNISQGRNMAYDNSKMHIADWTIEQNYYIRCSDAYNNQPEPTECSIIVRPYALPTTEEGTFL